MHKGNTPRAAYNLLSLCLRGLCAAGALALACFAHGDALRDYNHGGFFVDADADAWLNGSSSPFDSLRGTVRDVERDK